MSLEAILESIGAAGQADVARLRAETESRVRQTMDGAERAALGRQGEARRAALLPAAGESARLEHQAKLEALRMVGDVRERLVETALAETRRRLARVRADPDYPAILRRLTEEAIGVLGDGERGGEYGGRVLLECDPRDESLLRRVLDDLGLPKVPVTPSLDCWGGLAARSRDGRIVATNTLEARLELALPLLRRDLAAFFEGEIEEEKETGKRRAEPY